jgi:hypothetical protein
MGTEQTMNTIAPGPQHVLLAEGDGSPPPSAQLAMQIECPVGLASGGLVQITTPDGRCLDIPVPAGVEAGDKFVVQVPPAAPVAIPAAAVSVVHVAEQPVATAAARVDTAALTGMRGLAALHVACGHYSAFSALELDLLGGAAMPFFYLLSGFVLTLGYSKGEKINTRKFFQNRCARLMPTFYLTNILGLLMLLTTTPKHLGWTEDTLDDAFAPGLNVGLTVFGMNSWLSPFYGIPGVLPLNAVTWTITTMIFFYMVFPCRESVYHVRSLHTRTHAR